MSPIDKIAAGSDILLTFLEKISEESTWKAVFGERLVSLLQKYFGNDAVALSLAYYITPILKAYWSKFSSKFFKRVQPHGTVTIKIYPRDNLYTIVAKYIYKHGSKKDSMTCSVAQYSDIFDASAICDPLYEWYDSSFDIDNEDDEDTDEAETARVHIKPPLEFDEELVYKGHTIKVEFKEAINTKDEIDMAHIAVSMVDRDTKRLHYILQEWSDLHNKSEKNNYVYKACDASWDFERVVPWRDINSVHLGHGQKERLIKDIQTFKAREDWYTNRRIPHRRGYLLYGPPGTGKSSIIQAVANYLKYDISILGSLASSTNDMLCELMQNLSSNTILLIEDIDHLFESSDNSKEAKKVTMSGLLNIMDGLQSKSGCIVFMTCNNISKITPALLRPGRIDVKLHLGYAAPEQVKDTFWRFMSIDEETSMPLADEEKAIARKYMEEFGNAIPANMVTTAEIQGYFIDILLEANSCDNGWTRDRIYKVLFERIPEFLERVERDRKQAEAHKKTQTKKVSPIDEASEDKSSSK